MEKQIWMAEVDLAAGCSWTAFGTTEVAAKRALMRAVNNMLDSMNGTGHMLTVRRTLAAFDDYFGINTHTVEVGAVYCDGSKFHRQEV